MKKFLRKWLEVPEVPEVPEILIDEVKKMVEDAIYEAMRPIIPSDYERKFWSRNIHRDIRGTLQRHIVGITAEKIESAAAKHISDLIEPEKIIDDIVSRIKRKQVM